MKKVLVVEDHPHMQDLVILMLKRMGFHPAAVGDGKEAVEMARKEKPLFVLMDILLPHMDGREATRIIRSNPETKDIPILAATCLFRDVEIKTVLDAGCDDCLVKPFTFEEFQTKVLRIISSSSQIAH